jgi:hypothetical protein
MKTLFLSVAFIALLTITSSAQLEKGSWIGGVSGNVGFSHSTSSSNHSFSYGINPYVMYLMSKNIAVGLNVDSRNAIWKNEYSFGDGLTETNRYYYNSLFLAPIIRMYFGNKQFRPYIGVTTGLSLDHTRNMGSTLFGDSKTTDFGFFLNPEIGISYWLNDKVFFDFKASYDLLNSNRIAGYRTADLKIGIGIKIGNPSTEK